MKKVLVLLGIMVPFFSYGQKKTDLQEMDLQGKVKSVREIHYNEIEKFDKIEKRGSFLFYNINEQGNKIEANRYNSDGSLDWKSTYQYDVKGNQIEKNTYNSDGSLNSKFTYQYDAKGNIIEANWYDSDGSLVRKHTYQYTYDQHGNWIKKIEYEDDKPNKITEREIVYYP